MTNVRRLSTALAALAAGAAACATAPATPEEATRRWAEARDAGDAATAAGLVTPGASLWPRSESRPTGAAGGESRREATWRFPAGRQVVVRAGDGGGGRIASGALSLDRAATPAEAVRRLGRAIASRDWGALHALLPAGERGRWTPERLGRAVEEPAVAGAWKELAGRIAAPLPEPAWLEAERRASFDLGAVTVVVAREEDGWKVADLGPAARFAAGTSWP